MAVIRDFLGAEQLLGTPNPENPSASPTAEPHGPAHPVEAADITGWGRGGESTMKRTYAIRALLSIVSALSAIFLVGGANAKW